MTPSDVQQYLLIVAFVVPGIIYQTVRARYLGEVPQNHDLAAKILRALSVSTLLALAYAIAFASTATSIIDSTPEQARNYTKAHPTKCAAWATVLLFLVPAVLARLNASWPTVRFFLVALLELFVKHVLRDWPKWLKRYADNLRVRTTDPAGLRFEPTATAWDWGVNHGGTSKGFVRVCDADGNWWGGAFGATSYFSNYPEDPALFVEMAWTLSDTGEFVEEQAGSRGSWIPCKDARTVQFLAVNGANSGDGSSPDDEPESDELDGTLGDEQGENA
jgi:hypothetical protein